MDRQIARIEQRLSARDAQVAPYSPPKLVDLIKRIDSALLERRAA